MTTATPLLRAARKSRNLTQKAIADRLHVDQGRISRAESASELEYGTVERILGATGHRLYCAPTRRDDVATAASSIRSHLRRGDRHRALRAFIQLSDDLQAERGLIRGVLVVAEPEPTGEAVWDSALAALVSLRLNEENLPHPEWTKTPNRHLTSPRTLEVDPADPRPGPGDVPEEFLEHGVLIWSDTLASV